jgi:glycosyltransferase involved in cell wall biosynthesis
MNPIELSVVIPVYNEENRVEGTLDQSVHYLKSKRIAFEILVVDDGSRDRTVAVVEAFGRKKKLGKKLRVLKHPANRGIPLPCPNTRNSGDPSGRERMSWWEAAPSTAVR